MVQFEGCGREDRSHLELKDIKRAGETDTQDRLVLAKQRLKPCACEKHYLLRGDTRRHLTRRPLHVQTVNHVEEYCMLSKSRWYPRFHCLVGRSFLAPDTQKPKTKSDLRGVGFEPDKPISTSPYVPTSLDLPRLREISTGYNSQRRRNVRGNPMRNQ